MYHYGVESPLVDDGVERILWEVQSPDVHLQVLKVGPFRFVLLVHGFYGSQRYVDIGYGFVSVVKHFLAEPWISYVLLELPEPTLRILL